MIDIWFYQLREGDTFILEGDEYMKLWRYKTVGNEIYNARRLSDEVTRFVLDNQKVTPTDSYYKDRIHPINSDVHEM